MQCALMSRRYSSLRQSTSSSSVRLFQFLLVLGCRSSLSLSSSIFQSRTETKVTESSTSSCPSSPPDSTTSSNYWTRWFPAMTSPPGASEASFAAAPVANEPRDHQESVHLQLYAPLSPTSDPEKTNGTPEQANQVSNSNHGSTTMTEHSFTDLSGRTWIGLNTTVRKFMAYLSYHNVSALRMQIQTTKYVSLRHESGSTATVNHQDAQPTDNSVKGEPVSRIHPTFIPSVTSSQRERWRALWRQGRLLTDRTELLAVYPSDDSTTTSHSTTAAAQRTLHRGGFTDLLGLYTERLLAIVQDERDQDMGAAVTSSSSNSVPDSENNDLLLSWLQRHYGYQQTMRLFNHARTEGRMSATETKAAFKHFLEWFRREFPYYYDRCEACGASMKEYQSNQSNQQDKSDDDALKISAEQEEDEEEDHHPTFLGYIYPSSMELGGKASRTELYRCHECASFTRFPRFNAAQHVLDSRKGRCGEYSMLLFRFLRALKYPCRWVVDWADHVWAEVGLEVDEENDRDSAASERRRHLQWVHLDPCEAAVDENLLYQSWGKKQTYILAFHAPLRDQSASGRFLVGSDTSAATAFPYIEDVTLSYTSDPWDVICQRRDEQPEQVQTAIHKASLDLQAKLASYYHVD